MNAECVLPCGAVLAEGPVWHQQHLYWVDIERGEVHRWHPPSGVRRHWNFSGRVGFAVPTQRGDFLLGQNDSLVRMDLDTGALTPFATPTGEPSGNRFNDAKCDDAGRLWAGTLSIREEPRQGTLYRVDPSGELHPVVREVSISNGLAWSPDGRTLYYIDSPTRRVDAFDFDPDSGAISGRRTVITVTDGFPDGMCADAVGHLWIALWGGWAVACHDPRTGRRLAEVRVPVEAVTSCCFGDGDTLWITTASRDLDAAGRHLQPLAGGIFRAAVGVGGPGPTLFRG
ncbi:MAG: SMP-30/gluconolactonase/LRE family protein [Verrucomicrobiota bacterium]